jgi:hypothetical protein
MPSRRDPLPTFIERQLSGLVDAPPAGPNWAHERLPERGHASRRRQRRGDEGRAVSHRGAALHQASCSRASARNSWSKRVAIAPSIPTSRNPLTGCRGARPQPPQVAASQVARWRASLRSTGAPIRERVAACLDATQNDSPGTERRLLISEKKP